MKTDQKFKIEITEKNDPEFTEQRKAVLVKYETGDAELGGFYSGKARELYVMSDVQYENQGKEIGQF